MKDAVLLVAPLQRGAVEVCHVVKHAPGKEVFLHKANQALHLPFGEGVPRLAQFCLEANDVHERVVVRMPDRISVQIAAQDDALHIVREHVLGNTQALKSVYHADEKIFLFCVWEKLDVASAAVVARHGKACASEGPAGTFLHVREAPVHLQ